MAQDTALTHAPLTEMASGHAQKLAAGNDLSRRRLFGVGERRRNAQMRELPDANDRAQNEQAVNDHFKKTAFFFFRLDEQSVSRSPPLIE